MRLSKQRQRADQATKGSRPLMRLPGRSSCGCLLRHPLAQVGIERPSPMIMPQTRK